MAHPADKFLRYLLSVGRTDDHDYKWFESTVLRYDLYRVTLDEFEELRASMKFPVPFTPNRATHEPSMRFIKAQGIFNLFFPTEDTEAALSILGTPFLRQPLEILLLGRVPAKDAANRLQGMRNIRIRPGTIEEYEKLFFNVQGVSFDDWTRYNAEHNDSRPNREAALLHGPNMALHRLGFQTVIESKQIMKTAQQNLYFRLLEMRGKELTPDVMRMENSTVRTLLAVDARLKESDLALKEVLDNFKKFQQDQSRKKVASIEEIAGRGSYSGLIDAPANERVEGEMG